MSEGNTEWAEINGEPLDDDEIDFQAMVHTTRTTAELQEILNPLAEAMDEAGVRKLSVELTETGYTTEIDT